MVELFGIPWWVLGSGCLVIAAVYMVLWPKPVDAERRLARSAWEHLILRWFHALVWVPLAVSCFLRSDSEGSAAAANLFALLALVLYGLFLFTLARDRATGR